MATGLALWTSVPNGYPVHATTVHAGSLAVSGAVTRGDPRPTAPVPRPRLLRGAVLPIIASGRARRLGTYSKTETISLAVGLKIRRPGVLNAVLAELTNRHSPRYHHWLTQADANRLFNPTASQQNAVAAWLRSNGLAVTHTYPNHLLVDARGSVGSVERMLHVSLHRYQVSLRHHLDRFFAPSTAPRVPAIVSSIVGSIVGLDSFPRFHMLANGTADNSPPYYPQDFANAYDVNPLWNAGYTGSGEHIGITLWTVPPSDSTLQHWGSVTGAGAATTANGRLQVIPVDGGSTMSDAGEAGLDIEYAGGLAPGATVDYYESPTSSGMPTSQGLLDALNLAGTDSNDNSEISNSWGGCEASSTSDAFTASAENIFASNSATGHDYLFGAGDAGSSCGGADPHPVFPASSPYVTSVGGTAFSGNVNGGYPGESAWTGSGGGYSNLFSRPSWQTASGLAPNGMRGYPDVSANADPNRGAEVCYGPSSSCAELGGTSLAAPVWAGTMADIDGYVAAQLKPGVGYLAPASYSLASTNPAYVPLHDVTSGADGSYSAAAGWDSVTGWGSPDAWNLARDLVAAPPLTPAPTYYVNGDPSVGSNNHDCTEPKPVSGQAESGPCLTIQAKDGTGNGGAITKAPPDSIVNVAGSDTSSGGSFNGVYCEQITIDESLTLQALSLSNPPTVDGGAPLPGGGTNPCASVGGDVPGHSVVTVGDSGWSGMKVTLQGLIVRNGDASSNPPSPCPGASGWICGLGQGGGIFVYKGVALSVMRTTATGNTACAQAGCTHPYVSGEGQALTPGGGGIFLESGSELRLMDSTVSDNIGCTTAGCYKSANPSGGGIYESAGSARVNLVGSTVSGNVDCSSCVGGFASGGGVYVGGTAAFTGSTVSGNVVCGSCSRAEDGQGGGIYVLQGGNAILTDSAVSGNVAYECTSNCGQGGNAVGGGIFNDSVLTMANSSITDNAACTGPCNEDFNVIGNGGGVGGGIFNDRIFTLTNTTVSGNDACSGSPCEGQGGGIFDAPGSSVGTLVDSTVSANAACVGSCQSGWDRAGGIENNGGIYPLSLTNTIVAGNQDAAGSVYSPDCSGQLQDGTPDANSNAPVGHNIIGDGTGCTFAAGATDQVGGTGNPVIDPKLGPLQNNGGPTQTMALLPGSPAIGAGDPTTCGLLTLSGGAPGPNGLDQRGAVRSPASCDIGAYDTWGDTHADSFLMSAPATATPGVLASTTLTAVTVEGNTVPGYTGTVHFAGSDRSGALPGDYTFTSSDHGTHSFRLTFRTAGSQTVTATDKTYSSVTGSATVGVLPGPPVNVTASPSGQSGTVAVSWAPPGDYAQAPMSSYANTPISSYTVSATCASPCTPPAPVTFNNTGGNLVANVTGLTNGTAYTFSVTATSAIGTGPASGTASATPSKIGSYPPTVPQSPTNVSGTRSNASVNLSWTAPPQGANGSGWGHRALETYTVTCSPSCGSQSFWGGATSGTVTGLTNGTPYTFQVQAVNMVGGSAPSSPSGPVTPATVPDAPTGLNASPSGDGAVALSWTAPANNGGDSIVSYTVSCNPSCPLASGLTSTGTSTTVSGLTDGTSYTFTVAATNTVGTGAQSSASIAVTPSPPAASLVISDSASGIIGPGTPITLTVTAKDSNNDTATGYVGTVHFTSTDPNAQLPADYTFTPGDLGSHTFNVTIWAPGQETVNAADAANGLSVTTPAISLGIPIEASDFNVVDVPLQGSITSAAGIASSMNDPSQLGPGAIDQVDLADNGGWDSYVPDASPDLPIGATQGVLVDNTLNSAGTWVPPGSPYTSAQTVQLQPGWNLVAAPYPYSGVTASEINTEAPACGVQEVAIWNAGTYVTWVPPNGSANDLQIPSYAGIWVLCQSAGSWTPGSSLLAASPPRAHGSTKHDGRSHGHMNRGHLATGTGPTRRAQQMHSRLLAAPVISDLRPSSFAVSWMTRSPVRSVLEMRVGGRWTKVGDVRGAARSRTHFVAVPCSLRSRTCHDGLRAHTRYAVRLLGLGRRPLELHVSTTRTLSPFMPIATLSGRVEGTWKRPLPGALVYAVVHGTGDASDPLATITSENGGWTVTLSDAVTGDGRAFPLRRGDRVSLEILNGHHRMSRTVTIRSIREPVTVHRPLVLH